MKILYIHQYFNTPAMSGGTRSYEMARRFAKNGHVVYLLTSSRATSSGTDWYLTEEAGINIYWLPVPYHNAMSFADRVWAFVKFAYRAAIKASQIKADIIFATSTPLTIALPAVYASKRQKIPMVFEVRDLWPELPIAMGALRNPMMKFLARKLELFAYKNASAIVALSPGMKAGVLRSGFPSDNVAVIPNSADIRFFDVDPSIGKSFIASRSHLDGRPLLIYTGTFGLINGVGYMVDLAVHLAKINSNVCILLIGDGAEFNTISKRAKFEGVLGQNLFIEPPLPKNVMPSVFCAAKMCSALFIDVPEMRPNSANKFFDSLAAGKPIFINYGGWMHDLVVSHECGLSMWQKSHAQVALQINEKLNDESWLVRAGESARRLAEMYFDRDLLASQLEQVLISSYSGEPQLAAVIAPGTYS